MLATFLPAPVKPTGEADHELSPVIQRWVSTNNAVRLDA